MGLEGLRKRTGSKGGVVQDPVSNGCWQTNQKHCKEPDPGADKEEMALESGSIAVDADGKAQMDNQKQKHRYRKEADPYPSNAAASTHCEQVSEKAGDGT
jgi:hypothetical protein